MDDKECVNCLESICNMFVVGSKNCEGQALEYQQHYILAIRYAIAKIQSCKGDGERILRKDLRDLKPLL